MALLRVVVPPTSEPVSFEEMWAHLRLVDDDDARDAWAALRAAREQAEKKTGLSLSPRTLELVLGEWKPANPYADLNLWREDGGLYLPFGPVQSIRQIAYTALNATAETVVYDQDAVPAVGVGSDWWVASPLLYATFATGWPSGSLAPGGRIRIRYAAGYADPAIVPHPIKQWIKMQAAALFENRERVAPEFRAAQNLSAFADELLAPYVDRVA